MSPFDDNVNRMPRYLANAAVRNLATNDSTIDRVNAAGRATARPYIPPPAQTGSSPFTKNPSFVLNLSPQTDKTQLSLGNGSVPTGNTATAPASSFNLAVSPAPSTLGQPTDIFSDYYHKKQERDDFLKQYGASY